MLFKIKITMAKYYYEEKNNINISKVSFYKKKVIFYLHM